MSRSSGDKLLRGEVDAVDPFASSSGSAENDLYSSSVPIPAAAFGVVPGLDPTQINPMFGQMSRKGPDYLQLDSRSWTEKMFYNTGTVYLGGLGLGGLYGGFLGFKTSPSKRFRIRLNAVLNSCGKKGSRLGNSLGCLVLMYSLSKGVMSKYNVESRLGGFEHTEPTIAAVVTGTFFKLTAGLRAASFVGLTAGLGIFGLSVLGKKFSDRPWARVIQEHI